MSLKICLIGCGEHAWKVHGPSLRKYRRLHPETELAACCDINRDAALGFAARFGFSRSYVDYERMLDCEQPDAVSVLLPPELIHPVGRVILSRGIPALLEKPPGMTQAELENLATVAEAGGTINQVAFNRRYTAIIRYTHQRLNDFLPSTSAFQVNYEMIRFNRWDADFATTAIHALDTALFLSRSPYVKASFDYCEAPGEAGGVIGATIEALTQCGTRVHMNFQPVAGVVLERASIHGLEQSMTLDIPVWGAYDSPGRLRHWHQDRLVHEISGSELMPGEEMYEQSGFYAENEAFFESVRHHRPATPGLRDACQSVALMEAFRRRCRGIEFPDQLLSPPR
ncbi:MAG TPA: Gfo/Idh/MocA family oxidoreductase [Chthoniobacteraceae bacterium]|nr:Gfo/Idh/MocA family oxidoreductase [Chthoniobacteraceae bacterium]